MVDTTSQGWDRSRPCVALTWYTTNAMTRITLRLFAHCADRLGAQHALELPDDASGLFVAAWLADHDERLRGIERTSRIAINDRFADWPILLKDGDEVAVIPPVSGG